MMGWVTIWWAWIALALLLGIVEILAPGFIFLGIAIGAAIVGALILLLPDLIAGIGTNALFALFGALSLLSWIGLKLAFRGQSSGAEVFDKDVND